MKTKILLLIVTAILASCGKSSLESKANKQIEYHMNKAFGEEFKSVELRDFKTIYSGDSIFVTQFKVELEDYSGWSDALDVEYYIMWSVEKEGEPKLRETFYPLDERSTIMERVDEVFSTPTPEPSDAEGKERRLRVMAQVADLFYLKDVRDADD